MRKLAEAAGCSLLMLLATPAAAVTETRSIDAIEADLFYLDPYAEGFDQKIDTLLAELQNAKDAVKQDFAALK